VTSIRLKAAPAPVEAPPPRFAVSGPCLKEKAPACVALDYETEAIGRRPAYPPRPVGAALQFPGERRGKYYTGEEMERQVRRAYASGLPILCQHGKFDLDVAEVHHGLPLLPWGRCHDTEYLLFLDDPHAKSLSLKPSAERILGIRPEERDRLREWVVANVPEARRKPSEWGAYICRAPENIVGPYAVGDLTRTKRLFEHLYPSVCARGMRTAYDRERRIMPVFLDAERRGIRADLRGLERDVPVFRAARERVGAWLRKRLGRPGLNLDADAQVAEALDAAGVVTEWTWTRGGNGRPPQRSVAKRNMPLSIFKDQKVAAAYGYYARCGTLLGTFLEPWLELAGSNGGFLRPNWNQVRQAHGNDNLVGTRSGRPSCDGPNLLAIVKKWENAKGDGYSHPRFLPGLPELALVRKYLLPDEGGIILHRDVNQQELRVLAHFEGGSLAERYRERPYRDAEGSMRFDIHSAVQAGILELTGLHLNRDSMKAVDFGPIYGKGKAALAEEIGVSLAQASAISAARDKLMPGLAGLRREIEAWGRAGKPIITWGGRQYYAEPASYSKKYGRVMDYYYKLLNYIVQPSSADVTKEAVVRYHDHPKRESRFLLTVYDELNASSPSLKGLSARGKRDCVAREMAVLRECIETIPISVPMLSDGKIGPTWGDLEKYWTEEEAREIV